MRILIADDHPVMRHSLATALSAEPDMEVVGQVADGEAAIESTEQMRPDVVLMDVSMPQMNGIRATSQIRWAYPQMRVIGLSMHAAPSQVETMLRAGACGYIIKGDMDEVLQALRSCARGRLYLSPGLLEQLGPLGHRDWQ